MVWADLRPWDRTFGIIFNAMFQTAQAMFHLPSKDVGYKYVNLYDCWQAYRNSTGYILVATPKSFPRVCCPWLIICIQWDSCLDFAEMQVSKLVKDVQEACGTNNWMPQATKNLMSTI
jgi:hypothetical protein